MSASVTLDMRGKRGREEERKIKRRKKNKEQRRIKNKEQHGGTLPGCHLIF
jgi:hypothetical protein